MPVSSAPFALIVSLVMFACAQARATDESCIRSYTGVGALEIMIAFEKRLDEASAFIDRTVHQSGVPLAEQSKLSADRHAQIAAIRVQYDALSDEVLEADTKIVASFERRFDALETQLANLGKTSTTIADESHLGHHAFADLIAQPSLLKSNVAYSVPMADTIGGVANAQRLSVSFAPEVLAYFTTESQRGQRFLRAIQKGYVPSGSGSGIVRITDQHEKLVEVKVIGGNEGHQRLIGCRKGDGTISILKVYEKRNEGGGGSLKRFASLCD